MTKEVSGWRHRLETAEKRTQELAERKETTEAELKDASAAPDEIAAKATELLVSPDKMSLEYKALDKAISESKQSAERLLFELGAYESPYALHFQRFGAEQFPFGIGFSGAQEHWTPNPETAEILASLPVSSTRTPLVSYVPISTPNV